MPAVLASSARRNERRCFALRVAFLVLPGLTLGNLAKSLHELKLLDEQEQALRSDAFSRFIGACLRGLSHQPYSRS